MLDEILTRNDLRQEIEDYAFLIEMMEYDMHVMPTMLTWAHSTESMQPQCRVHKV